MVFSKFDFSESPQEKKEPEALTGSKKYKKLLEQLEKKKQKIEQVSEQVLFSAPVFRVGKESFCLFLHFCRGGPSIW